MSTKMTLTLMMVLAVFASAALLPSVALASQGTKNQWRNLAIGGGALAGYGLLTHNGTATTVGVLGGGYSLYRYEQDRKSQSAARRARARYYYEHHMRYHRQYDHSSSPSTYYRNGREYYHYDGHLYAKNLSTGARSLVR